MSKRIMLIMTLMSALTSTAVMAQAPAPYRPAPQGAQLDLAKPFHTRSAWRFVVTEGPLAKDFGDNDAPGALTLCLYKGRTGPCLSDTVTPPTREPASEDAITWEPHYLLNAKIVYPQGENNPPFLLIVTGSVYSGDGNQLISTQLVAYDVEHDAFRRVYSNYTGHNNNEETRFISDGPLRGSVITAEPQEHLPYGYWITVNKLSPAGMYRQALRYRSATLYNDGNRLAVIDSEMPNIERRLGRWRPGQPIPTPNVGGGKSCLKPTLRHTELWCD